MADFFSDLFDSVTNQQVAPQQTIIPTNELLSQSYGALSGQVAPGLVSWNQALAPGLTDVQLGVTNQLDPSILSNLRGANKSILDQLNLGASLGQELQEDVVRNALEGSAASGFGVGVGGRGLVARDLGITGLDLLRRRQQDALQAGTTGTQLGQSFYNPLQYSALGQDAAAGIANNIQQVQAAKDELANITENVRRQNFSALINTGGRIAGMVVGGVVGAYTGNAAGGVQAGGEIGGNIFGKTGVAGYGGRGQQSSIGGQQYGIGGNRDYTSFLSGLFSGGGGSSQADMRQTAFEQGGVPMSSY